MDVYKVNMKICVISANLGGIDNPTIHVEQSIPYDYFLYTDENFPPRFNSFTPRLQAKIPKFFGWQLKPGYDYYVWLDSSISLDQPNTLEWLIRQCDSVEIATLKHDKRTTIESEYLRTKKGVREESMYYVTRYVNEWIDEQMAEIKADKNYVDDTLCAAGVFIYKNTPGIQGMLKEWWYHVSRYLNQDQLAFPFVLKNSGVKYKIIDEIYWNCKYIKHARHKLTK